MINLVTFEVLDTPTFEEGVKYLKTLYLDNYDRYSKKFLEPVSQWLSMNDSKCADEIVNLYRECWLDTKPYTYFEAFAITNNEFRGKVFSVINVPEMVQNLGSIRLKTNGIELENKVFIPVLNEFKIEKITQVYEIHEISGKSLGLDNPLYAIKCWCTSTNNEHWIWLDKMYDDPLEGIASTCKIYKPMLGNIKHIIRQGDVFLFEMEKPVKITEHDEIISLTKDIYFKLLKSQS